MDLWTYEREAWADGAWVVCGVDEAGAGPLAGPVYAAAVILPREIQLPGLNDSAWAVISSYRASRFFSVSFLESFSPGRSSSPG